MQLGRHLLQPPALSIRADLWELRVMPVWEDTLRYADYLVRGGRYNRPCHVPPRTWGGPMDVRRAVRRGLYPIGCAGTANDGFATADVCRRDGRWLCDPRFDPWAGRSC
jgi:hypothetical protein